MKKILSVVSAAVLMLALAACGKGGSLSDTIDDETGAYLITADNAGKGTSIGSLGGGFTLGKGQSVAVDPELTSGTLSFKLLDENGDAKLEESITGTKTELYGVRSGEYSLMVSCDENGTTGTVTIVPVDDDVFFDQDGDLEKTLKQMKEWTKVETTEEAAKAAGFESFTLPDPMTTELDNGPMGQWDIKCGDHMIEAKGYTGAAELVVRKSVYAGDGDNSGVETTYEHSWTRDINGLEVHCYGNKEGRATKTTWVDGNYMYSIMARGQGSARKTFGLGENDINTLVGAVK
ncbi:MAG: hypothetical protein Q4C09_08025 [Atopobiaceae bacterium]|nr:hypothetical protein [Atopobiaceae bacterium]